MYKLTASLALLALAQAAMAAIAITNPVAGTTWKQGSKATIAWTATGDDASGDTQITLMQGAATQLQTVETISDSVKGSAGKYTWTVPKDTPNGADYTVAFGSAPTFYYSHYFTIGKAAATNASASASGSGAAATASVPMSTAAGISTAAAPSAASASGSSNSSMASASGASPSASASTSSGARSAAAAIAVPAVAAAVAVAALF